MKKLQIQECQNIELAILANIHDFCEQKGITYFLYYGSLLGAIRHGGPIPWDDDIDIALPRKDYERFIREYVDSEEFKLYAPEKGNSVLRCARVCDVKYTEAKALIPFTHDRVGVWIDVVAIDGVYDDEDKEARRRKEIAYLKIRMVEARYGFDWVCAAKTFVGRIKRMFKHVVFPLFLRAWVERYSKLVSEVDYESATMCASLMVSTYGVREYLSREWIAKTKIVKFAGLEARVPCEYEKILEQIYGDWRTPIRPDGKEYITHYLSVVSRD